MVPNTKQIADFITWSRALLVALLIWQGLTKGSEAMPMAMIIVLYNWTADSIDGPLARKGSKFYQSWIGRHDLEIDMLFSTGLLIYLATSGFVSWPATTLYLILWAILFWWKGIVHTLGVIYQAPIYVWFIIEALRHDHQFGLWILIWLIVAIVVTWPKFPKVIVPVFLTGFKNLFINGDET